jgi:hypothetical protein
MKSRTIAIMAVPLPIADLPRPNRNLNGGRKA